MNTDPIRPQSPSAQFSMDDFANALEEYDYQFTKGQVVRGKVFDYGVEGAYVDIGGKSPGLVPPREASLHGILELSEVLPLNTEMEFLVIGNQNADGQVKLSLRQLKIKRTWDELAEIAENKEAVEMKVTGTNRGGVIGEVNGLRAFIPRSHLIEKDDLESLIGQNLTATFLEVKQDKNKLILSQREIARAAAISRVKQGNLMAGKIVSIKPYGVFVDLEGITGLLHIKQVSQNQVESLTTLFSIGQVVKVIILEVDEYKNRISLSTRVLENYPGEILEKLDEVMDVAEERLEQARAKLQEEQKQMVAESN